jgi:hypothetical protein
VRPASEFTLRVSSSWSELTMVNSTVEEFLHDSGIGADERFRLTMIACELVENAIKYGHFPSEPEDILLSLKLAENTATVQVRNPVSDVSRGDLRELDRTIQWTRSFQDPFEAYVERVKAISGEPLEMSKSCLGIARIAYEGRAALDFYLDEDGSLSVSAVSNFA